MTFCHLVPGAGSEEVGLSELFFCWNNRLLWLEATLMSSGKVNQNSKACSTKTMSRKSSIQLEELQSCMIIICELITTSYPFHVHVVISISPSDDMKILIIATSRTVCSASVVWIVLPYYHANRTPHAETKKRRKKPPQKVQSFNMPLLNCKVRRLLLTHWWDQRHTHNTWKQRNARLWSQKSISLLCSA